MIFTRLNKASRPSSAIAMALVLAATGTLGAVAFEQPAFAKKKKDKEKEEAQGPNYTKEFIAAYNEANNALNAEGADPQAVKALIPAVLAAVSTPDDRNAAGGLLFNLSKQIDDEAMELQGLEMMQSSGKLDPQRAGQINVALYQIYRSNGDIAKSREALERAIDANYSFNATMGDGTNRALGADDMRLMIADLYFEQDQYAEGVNYIAELIQAKKAAGEPVPENWIRTGLSRAYNNSVPGQAPRFVRWLAADYPTPEVWADAVVITLNSGDYANPDILDLLRLSRRLNHYNAKEVLSEYVEMLDSRRYPGEVVSVIDQGYTLGVIDRSDPYIAERRKEADSRLAADKAGLPELARDARRAGVDLKTLVVAGDTFLSYDQPAEAEEFYTKALTMSGVETPMVLTRLGIAQYDQGKYAEAIETFKKVEGARKDIASIWALYATSKAGS